MDLELHKKAQEKLHGEEERIKQAMEWIEKVSGMQRVGEFPDCLKSGKMLCALANALRPGMSSLSSYSWCLRFHSGIIPHVNAASTLAPNYKTSTRTNMILMIPGYS